MHETKCLGLITLQTHRLGDGSNAGDRRVVDNIWSVVLANRVRVPYTP